MPRYAVTGISTRLMPFQRDRVFRRLQMLQGSVTVTEWSTGGADGVDTLALLFGLELFPDALHRLVYPAEHRFNRDLLEVPGVEHVGVLGSYMDRNDELVRHCDVLLAFPAGPGELLRSGTWATVRRARKAGKPILITPLGD